MSFKIIKIVMLPSKEKGVKFNNHFSEQHLYFLSDEEIKEGDCWAYLHEFSLPQNFTITKNNLPKEWFEKLWDRVNYKKVIASTDPSLGLPQPSERFIKEFIKQWNKDEKIEEVLVEYDTKFLPEDAYPSQQKHVDYCKVNPKDNTITIKSIQTSWTRLEIMGVLHKVALLHGKDYSKLWQTIDDML